jgi:hypothetical protein
MFKELPQIDSLLFHSIECDWFWGNAVSMYPCEDDQAAGKAFRAYLDGLGRACREDGKKLMFWTHVSGISARQIRSIHTILADYPELVVMEDNTWPNSLWPHVDSMAHVADDIKEQVFKQRFGLALNLTDGEYYGAGAMPTAYPEPMIKGAEFAVEHKAEYAFIRLNETCSSLYGTLGDVNRINVLGVSEAFWEGARPLDELWLEWSTRCFGPGAAAKVVSALKKSWIIIKKGLSANNMELITHSGLATGYWQPGNDTGPYALFSKPGQLLVDKPYDELTCPEFRPWQAKVRGIEMETFLRESATAEKAAREGLEEIKSAAKDLEPEHASYLQQIFEDALFMIAVFRKTAVAVQACAACRQEPGPEKNKALEQACLDLEEYAAVLLKERGEDFRGVPPFMKLKIDGKEVYGYGAPLALRHLARVYREYTAQ